MIALLLLLSTSWAGDTLIRPPAPVLGSVDECSQPIPVTIGETNPELVWSACAARCSGVVVPSSQLAYLLATEIHRDAIEALHVQDIEILQAKLADRVEPRPWLDRTIGGAAVAGVLGTVYLLSGGR